jgi:GT2 family glycosyltransferase
MLSVVTVAYRSRGIITGLLDSIAAHPPAGGVPETVVVDNASGDGLGDLVAERYPWARFLPLPRNVGMGAGLNAGVRVCSGDGLVLVNPDVVFTPGALAGFEAHRAAEVAGRFPFGRPVIVGPRLLNGDGSLQLSAGYFPNLLRILAGQLRPRAVRKYEPLPTDRPGLTDWATGACLFVGRRVFEELGGFDERFFLYYEETDLCRRARRRGVRTLYDPRITCFHLHPLQDRPVSPLVAGFIRDSRRRYFAEHCGPLESAALRIVERLGP